MKNTTIPVLDSDILDENKLNEGQESIAVNLEVSSENDSQIPTQNWESEAVLSGIEENGTLS